MLRRQSLGLLAASGSLPLALGAGLAGCATRAPGLPRVSAGRLERMERFASRFVEPRHVDVWLPPGYSPERAHAVLYMHDGQMLFDAETTWNKQAWQVSDTASRLIEQGWLREFIVVGVWNNGEKRFPEYYPAKFMPHLPEAARQGLRERGLKGEPLSDLYLRFLVEELKPAVDARWHTVRGPGGTRVMGSSMGGLISVYALLEYPQVFGAAAALSTHWITMFEDNEVFPAAALAYLREKLPAPGALRLYMDRGTTQLDAQYANAQNRVDALLRERGFREPEVVSRVFEGTGHNERDWAGRLGVPLAFLLGR